MTEAYRKNNLSGFLPRFSIFYIMLMISIMMVMAPLLNISWMKPGNYDFRTAMYFHGIMAPSLLLFYLLTVFILPIKELSGKGYGIAVMADVLLICIGSMFNTHTGLSTAAGIQIAGFFLLDILGIILAAGLVRFYRRQGPRQRDHGVALLILSLSVIFILMAETLGHLLGGAQDLGVNVIPGIKTWLSFTGITKETFMDNVKTSHSHLIVAALLCGLAALAAIRFEYKKQSAYKKILGGMGLWMMLIGMMAACAVYLIAALGSWNIPAVFISGYHGENGIAMDDLILGLVLSGGVLLLLAISLPWTKKALHPIIGLRLALFIDWACGFAGSVFIGYYIECHETFFGGGELPAAGAKNDLAFIRGHLLYSFLLLPLIFILLIAIDLSPNRDGPIGRLLPLASIIGVLAGLCSEFVWVATLNNLPFKFSAVLLVIVIASGTIALYPRNSKKVPLK